MPFEEYLLLNMLCCAALCGTPADALELPTRKEKGPGLAASDPGPPAASTAFAGGTRVDAATEASLVICAAVEVALGPVVVATLAPAAEGAVSACFPGTSRDAKAALCCFSGKVNCEWTTKSA